MVVDSRSNGDWCVCPTDYHFNGLNSCTAPADIDFRCQGNYIWTLTDGSYWCLSSCSAMSAAYVETVGFDGTYCDCADGYTHSNYGCS